MNAKDRNFVEITDKIIAKLEEGTVPWHQPWGMAVNLKSGKSYTGINSLILGMAGYESKFWGTYNQIKALGGHVKKGSKAQTIIYWGLVEKKEINEETGEKEVVRRFPILKTFKVFNFEQTADLIEPKVDTEVVNVDSIIDGYEDCPVIDYGGDRAYYRPSTDSIGMPPRGNFDSDKKFASTLFHEIIHSTGHESRLNRDGLKNINFGSQNYSQEELVAELGAAFLCNQVGIVEHTIDNSASYIAGWLKVLKNDKKMIVFAAAQAQKAADRILG